MKIPADARESARAVLARAGERLTEPEAKQLLACFGIRVPHEGITLSASATSALARQIGFPVSLKAVSPDLRNKREAGALALGVKNAAEVRAAFARVLQRARKHDAVARLEGVLVSEMVPRGIDVALSLLRARGRRDEITFGLGGLLGVAAGGTAHRAPPIGPAEAKAMLREVPGVARVLQSHGDPPAIAELLERFGRLAADLEEIVAFDLDVHAFPRGKGYVVVDAWATRRPSR